jgi:hypothetical protein
MTYYQFEGACCSSGIADGQWMLLLSTPVCVLLFVLCLHLHLVLSLSVWLLGRENEMHFVFCASDSWQMALRSWSCACSSVSTWLVRGA